MVWEILMQNVLGIIIAASMYLLAGLKSTGAVDAAISFLKNPTNLYVGVQQLDHS